MTALTIKKMNDGALDLQHIEDVALSSASTATDRLGNSKLTVRGAVDTIRSIRSRGAWSAATAYEVKDVVSVGGGWHICLVAHLSSGSFIADSVNWRLYQGVLASELTASDGSTRVSYQQRGLGAVTRPIEDRFDETVSICDFGGSDNGMVVNSSALALASIRLGGRGVLRFPRVEDVGVYVFDATMTRAASEGLIFDVDSGVTLFIPDIGYIHPSVRVVRDTRLYQASLKTEYWLSPISGVQAATRNVWIGANERDTSVLRTVVCNANLVFRKVVEGSDIFENFAPVYASESGVQFGTISASEYQMAFKRVVPGEEVTAQFSSAVDAIPVAMVRTPTSYYGMSSLIDDFAQPKTFSKAAGAPGAVRAVEYLGRERSASYSAFKSLWTIRINSIRSFSVLFNGAEVLKVATDNEIIEAGYGAKGAAGGSLVVVDWVYAKGKAQGGNRYINLATFGDSNTDEAFHQSWPTQMAQMLDQSGGLRIGHVRNYGHSGDSTADQLLLCTPANIASYDVVGIMLALNDVQNLVDEVTVGNNIRTMLSVVKAAGKLGFVILTTMFYGQEQAGAGRGQPTHYYDRGKGIRAKILWTCADMGVPVVDALQLLGPLTSDWMNSEINSLANLGRDPVVHDNIHLTNLSKLILARGAAATVLGMLRPSTSLETSLALLPSGALRGGWGFVLQHGQWMRDVSGIVTHSGVIDRGVSIADGTVIYVMPENLLPLATRRISAWCGTGFTGLQIDHLTGEVRIYGFPANAGWVSIDELSYPTK